MDGKPVAIATQPDPFDPDGICDRCGQKGTVVRTGRQDVQSATVGRYCRACWPTQRAAQVRQSVEEGAQYITVQRHASAHQGGSSVGSDLRGRLGVH
jgi:hypothetical protein